MSIFEKSILRILKKFSFDTNNNLKVVIAESIPVSVSEIDLTKIAGTPLTPRDWSLDFENLQNIDVLLSSRASESTLSAINSKLPSTLTALGNFKVGILEDTVGLAKDTTLSSALPRNLTQIGGVNLTGRDWSLDFAKLQNIDTALSVLFALIRWGRNVSPSWVHGGEVPAPESNTVLVSKTVSTGKIGFIYGFFITAGEANDFKINWTSGGVAYSRRIVLGSKGSVQYVDFVALNEGLPADSGTTITITNINAGGVGQVYQAGILYAEV
jgi:hypothetical protein